MTHKVVINTDYGGFGLSNKAEAWLKERGVNFEYCDDIERHNPLLVECVEKFGKEASGEYADLAVTEIEGKIYRIREYDGVEWIETPDSLDWIVIDEGTDNTN